MTIDKDDPKLQAALLAGTKPVNLCYCSAKLVSATGAMATNLGTLEIEGHYHDNNVDTREVTCAAGHKTTQQRVHRCPKPDCKWEGPPQQGLQDIGWQRVYEFLPLP